MNKTIAGICLIFSLVIVVGIVSAALALPPPPPPSPTPSWCFYKDACYGSDGSSPSCLIWNSYVKYATPSLVAQCGQVAQANDCVVLNVVLGGSCPEISSDKCKHEGDRACQYWCNAQGKVERPVPCSFSHMCNQRNDACLSDPEIYPPVD